MAKNLGNILKFRPSRQTVFSFLAIVMASLLLAFVVYAIGFLVSNMNFTFEISGRGAPEQRFDTKGFEALKLKPPQ